MIIAISGTPGTGKTETARALADSLGWKLLDLNKLAEERDLYSGYDEARKCRIVDVEGLGRAVEGISGRERNIVLESHYAHEMPCDIVVMLRTNPGELRNRLVSRGGWTTRKIEENVQAEIMEVCKSEAIEMGKKVVEVDTTGKTPAMVAEDIIGIIGDGAVSGA
jgi:adenylate kinase